jgi:glycosyltransferase involved in cell wall biosynthesis
LLAPRLGLEKLTHAEADPFSVDSVYQSLDRAVAKRLAKKRFDAVYAYEDGAETSFREARKQGLKTFYDLPIGYWKAARSLLLDEADREPEWASTLTGNADSIEKTDRKDAELELADVVFVASSFTRKTLATAKAFTGTIVAVPYGAPPQRSAPPIAERKPNERLRVLFVGSLGQRKGLSYLFSACNLLKAGVSLSVIGRRPFEVCPVLDRALQGVTWKASATHSEILAEMAVSDVFVFPSLFEGFGLVLLEALSMGLPIITTPNTAGPDLITHGVEGYIVPIRDSASVAGHLETLIRDPALLHEMKNRARERAQSLTWANYENTLSACVGRALGQA